MKGNYIKLERQLTDWRYWYSNTAVKLWILILIKANWKDGYFMGHLIPRGSLATSMTNLASEAGCSESTVRRWLKRFEEDGQITRKVTNRFTQINVIKYAFFQDVPESVTEQMTERVTDQMTERVTDQMTEQVTEQVTPNRRIKEREEYKKERRERGASAPAPSLEEVRSFVLEEKLSIDPDRFYHFYSGQGWKTSSGVPIGDWKSKARAWQSTERKKQKEPLPPYYDPNPIRKTVIPASQEEVEWAKAMLNGTIKKGENL